MQNKWYNYAISYLKLLKRKGKVKHELDEFQLDYVCDELDEL